MNETKDTSHQGYLESQLLIAMPSMLDPNFVRTVTLICQHGEGGAIGITLNRQSGFTLGEILQQLSIVCEDQDLLDTRVLEGGPVHRDRGFVLHSPREGFESSLQVSDQIMITTSRDVLAAIADGSGPEQFVVALGYAGWGDGQLEHEMRENAWLAAPADSAIVFELPIAQRWEHAVNKLGIDISSLHDFGGHA